MGTFIVALILLAVIIGSSASLARDRKRGRCSCGGDCGSCALCGERDGNRSARTDKNR